ncbi:DUF692 domain-containing protein [Acidithiobacillus sp. MC6.1]|nr:DUF692 domain-containing protein [Acidithiobacillus sp. MC6.1]
MLDTLPAPKLSCPGTANAIPAAAGIGLRAPHYAEVLEAAPDIAWMEMHSENLFAAGGLVHRVTERVRRDYPLSLHGVGLSLGSADLLNLRHLQQLDQVVQRYEPGLISEHLCWVSVGGRYLHDLLPLPGTEAMLEHLIPRINQVQETLGRQILIENVSAYLRFSGNQLPEWAMLNTLVERTGCGLLLDVNNLYVSSQNQEFDPLSYLVNLRLDAVQEIHLAGFSVEQVEDTTVLIDTHSCRVWPEVWDLYSQALRLLNRRVPVLIEWDSELPALDALLQEAAQAQSLLEQFHG